MEDHRLEVATLVAFDIAAALTWVWIETACAVSVIMSLVVALRKRKPVEEGFFSAVFFSGLVWASYFLPGRALDFVTAAYRSAQTHEPLLYEPNVLTFQRAITVAAVFWLFGSGWVGKIMPVPTPWPVVTCVWLLLTAGAGLGAAVLYLAAS
jgi:hypothetical protein